MIHQQKRAGIMVTHDLRMCLYADRIIQMEDGRIVNTISDRAAIEDLVRRKRIVEPERNAKGNVKTKLQPKKRKVAIATQTI